MKIDNAVIEQIMFRSVTASEDEIFTSIGEQFANVENEEKSDEENNEQ